MIDYPILNGTCKPWSLCVTFNAGGPHIKYDLLVAGLAECVNGTFYLDTDPAGAVIEISFLPGAYIRLRLSVDEHADAQALFERVARALGKFGVRAGDYEP